MSKSITHRDQQWTEPIPTEYIYDGTREVGIVEGEYITHLRILGKGYGAEIGAAIALEIESEIYAPVHDHRGNIRALVSLSTRQVVESYEYSAFGEETILDEDGKESPFSLVNNLWRFSSKRVEGDLVYFGERFYDPNLGCWINPDPGGFTDGVNLYVFVMNNPMVYLDFFGLETEGSRPFHQWLFDRFKEGWESRGKGDIPFYGNCGPPEENAGHQILYNVLPTHTYEAFCALSRIKPIRDEPTQNIFIGENPHFGFGGGVLTTYTESFPRAEGLAERVGGDVMYTHNKTYGPQTDLCLALLEKFRIRTDEVINELKGIRHMLENSKEYYIYKDCFSRDGAVFYCASRLLKREEKDRIAVYTRGSAYIILDREFADCMNYISTRDIVPMTNVTNYVRVLANKELRRRYCRFIKGEGFPLFDHKYNNRAYSFALDHSLERYEYLKQNNFRKPNY